MLPWTHPSPHLDRFSHLSTAVVGHAGHVLSPWKLRLHMERSEPPSNNSFLGPLESKSQTASRSVQPFLHISRRRVPILYNGPPPFLLKISPSHKGSEPHLIHGSLGPPESSTQTASRLVEPFLQGSLLWQTGRPTDHAAQSVTIGRIYVHNNTKPNPKHKRNGLS